MIKKYTTANGETRYMLKTYLGVDPLTGKQKRTTRRGFKSKKEAKQASCNLKQRSKSLQKYTKTIPLKKSPKCGWIPINLR